MLNYFAETWTLGYSKSSWVIKREGGIAFEALPNKNGWVVTNNLGFDLAEAELVVGWSVTMHGAEGRYKLGAFKDGERRKVRSTEIVPDGFPTGSTFLLDDPWAKEEPWTEEAKDDFSGAFALFFEQPDQRHGHLELSGLRFSVVGRAAEIYEAVTVDGLSPINQPLTFVRVPLTPPLVPNHLNPRVGSDLFGSQAGE